MSSVKLGYMMLFKTIEHRFEDVDRKKNKIAVDVVLKVTPDWNDEENKPCFTIGTEFRSTVGRKTHVWKALYEFFDEYYLEDDFPEISLAYEAFVDDAHQIISLDFPDHLFFYIEKQTIIQATEAVLKKMENTIQELFNVFQILYKYIDNQ